MTIAASGTTTSPAAPIRNAVTLNQTAPWAKIVGLSLGVRQNYGQVLDPVVYVPYRQDPGPSAWLIVRGPSQPEILTSPLREEVRALDPDLVLGNVTSLEDMAAALRLGDRVPMTRFWLCCVPRADLERHAGVRADIRPVRAYPPCRSDATGTAARGSQTSGSVPARVGRWRTS